MNVVAKKLQIKPGKRWLFYNSPANYLAVLDPLPDGTEAAFDAIGNFDGVQLFVKNNAELTISLEVIMPLLKGDTIFWITYPKKSSGMASDLEMMGNWDQVTKLGWGIVASASVDATWTALRLRPAGQAKLSDTRNDAIKNNEYAAFIDVDKKQITLPADVKNALTHSTNAMSFFETLSYSNRKEYVVWILSAKQEKTRTERLVKMVEKLLDKKKNPAEK